MRLLVILFCLVWTPSFGSDEDIELSAVINIKKYPHCQNHELGEMFVTVTGGKPPFQYLWTTKQTTSSITNLVSGRYKCIITDAKGNSVSLAETLPDKGETVDFDLVILTNPTCHDANNGEIIVTGKDDSRHYTYNWVNCCDNPSNSNLTEGDYAVAISDAYCTVNMTYSLVAPAPIEIKATKISDCSCSYRADGAVDLEVCGGTPPYTYIWRKDGVWIKTNITDMADHLSSGIYSVEVIDANNCTATISDIVISAAEEIEVTVLSINNVSQIYSNDGSISIDVSGGTPPYSYHWNDGINNTPVAINLIKGCYGVTVTDSQGCNVTMDNMCVKNPQVGRSITLSTTQMEACKHESIFMDMVQVTNIANFEWRCTLGECTFSNPYVLNPTVQLEGDYLQYQFIVCSHDAPEDQIISETFTIDITQEIIVEFNNVPKITMEGSEAEFSYSIKGGKGSYNVLFSPDSLIKSHTKQTVLTHKLNKSVQLDVTIEDLISGCKMEEKVILAVKEVECHGMDVQAINWLTPNSDGKNDQFLINGITSYPRNTVLIFNRWGDVILEFSDYNNENIVWSGMNSKGVLVTNGTYFYLIKSEGYSPVSGWIQVVTQ